MDADTKYTLVRLRNYHKISIPLKPVEKSLSLLSLDCVIDASRKVAGYTTKTMIRVYRTISMYILVGAIQKKKLFKLIVGDTEISD